MKYKKSFCQLKMYNSFSKKESINIKGKHKYSHKKINLLSLRPLAEGHLPDSGGEEQK